MTLPLRDGNNVGATLSLFERLTDERPSMTEETPRYRWASVRDLEASVMDHLRALLNARRGDEDLDLPFPNVVSSLVTYGVTDFNSLSLANPADREKLRRSIERAVRLFEPRLTRVQVAMEPWEAGQMRLQFRIDALLRVEPDFEPIVFDARLAKDLRAFELRESRA
jgi:type VI secretion system protein ImpF